ncbi:caax prenyl protease 1 [Malassezia pachydermatis]|uniref:CAAX prenyl protease n=1 Tax=Malassezia pachydermatis TaxID=77020 RepID=A0A0M8MXE6_9BASI|nr:caax prenyl protease 1 [Malassezia pachydermatis]KOS15481.1 caax prenyl protease 1 [Malassezia pachydermatis]
MFSLPPTLVAGIHAAEQYLDDPAIPWKGLVEGLLWVVYLFETYVSFRQYLMYYRRTAPKALIEHVSHEDFVKSQKYGRDKARFGFIADGLNHVVNLASVHYNWSAHIWVWSGMLLTKLGVAHSEQTMSGANAVVSVLVQLPLSMALSAYRNFVIEERHGFNKLTWRTFFTDKIKELLLTGIITVPLIALFVTVVRWAGDQFVVYVVLLIMAVVVFGSVIYPTLIQPLFNKLTPLPEGVLRDRVTALAKQLNFPLKHLYMIDGSRRSSHSNAYFYGFVPGGSKHIVIYDTLIEQSTPDEIEAVLAHELGHWKYGHPTKLVAMSFVQIFLNLCVFAVFIHNKSLFRAFGFGSDASAVARVSYLPVMIGMELFNLVVHPADALLQFTLNAVVRRYEYQADAFAAQLTRPAPTAAEKEARALLTSQPSTPTPAAEPSATVRAWLSRYSDAPSSVEGQDAEAYPALLQRALVKLSIHKYFVIDAS